MIEANMSQNVGRQVIGSLHQWDFGQSIKITGLDITGDTEVHFANEDSKTAIKMLGQYSREDASLKVEIPDVSLQSPRDICVFIYPTTENSGKTIRTGKIKMTARPKPEDYVQPETKDYLMLLLNEVEELISGGGSSVSDAQIEAAVKKYMEGHPLEEAGTAESKVSEHNTSDTAHNDIRLLLQGLTNRLNALADSDDTTLDQMSEVVAYIKSNKSLIDAITTSKVNVSDIIDNLTTNASNKPLSAAKGVALKTMIDAIVVPTKLSELENDSGYAKTTDIPDKLPNPQKITFAGAVSATYDGSEPLTVEIPSGGDGSTGQDITITTIASGTIPSGTEKVFTHTGITFGQLNDYKRIAITIMNGSASSGSDWAITHNEDSTNWKMIQLTSQRGYIELRKVVSHIWDVLFKTSTNVSSGFSSSPYAPYLTGNTGYVAGTYMLDFTSTKNSEICIYNKSTTTADVNWKIQGMNF